MASSLRKDVLRIFKTLHRTRAVVFKDDTASIEKARTKINDEFKKNKDVAETEDIEKLVKTAHEVDEVLRKNVVQATEKEPGVYELKIRPETVKLKNVPYVGPTAGAEEIKGQPTKCCQEQNAQSSKG